MSTNTRARNNAIVKAYGSEMAMYPQSLAKSTGHVHTDAEIVREGVFVDENLQRESIAGKSKRNVANYSCMPASAVADDGYLKDSF